METRDLDESPDSVQLETGLWTVIEISSKRDEGWILTVETVFFDFAPLPGSESVLRGSFPGAAFLQGVGIGAAHLSHGRLHAGRPLGRDHHMRPGRDAMVSGARPAQRDPLAHTSLPISPSGAQPRAGRALSQTLQAVQGQQETLPGVGQGGEDTEAGLWSDVRDRRCHTRRRTTVDTVARQVSIIILCLAIAL